MAEGIKKYRRLLGYAVAIILIMSCWLGIYLVTGAQLGKQATQSWLGILSVFSNLAATVIAFLVASTVFSREDSQALEEVLRRIVTESTGNPSTLGEVPWAELIDNAQEIDFVVQGWNGWAARGKIPAALHDFFIRKGIFRLYVCNPTSDGANYARSLLAQRLGNRSPQAVIEEIKGTFDSINEIRELNPDSASAPTIQVYETDRVNWYFAALFTGRQFGGGKARDVLVFSVYAHTKRSPWYMPAQMIYPDTQPNYFQTWFKNELAYLREGVPKIASDEVGTTGTNKA